MNTIFKKRGFAAVLLLSASVSNVIPADSANRRSPTSPHYLPAEEVLVEESIPNNPSSGFQAPFPAPLEPIGEPVPVVSGSEGDQESCWSRCFGGKKSSSSECEAGSAAVSSEGSTKECCLSCNFFSKHTRDISVISAAFALICGGIALKFHRDGKSSQDFDFFGDKISAEDAEAIEEKSKSAKFKEKIFGIGAVALGVLAVLSGWRFHSQSQRIKDLEEARRLWLANQLQPHMAKPSADSPESGGLCAGEQSLTSNLAENRREQAIRSQLARLRGTPDDINAEIRGLVVREGFERDSMISGFVLERKRLFDIQSLEAELLRLKSKPTEEKLLKALPGYRLAEAERIKAEKVTQAEQAEQAKKLRQQELLAAGLRLEGQLNSRQYPNARSLYSPVVPESPLSSSSSDSGSFSPENIDQNRRTPAYLRPQPVPSMPTSAVPVYIYSSSSSSASSDRPSFSPVNPRQRSAEFSSSPLLPSRPPLRQHQPPMSSSSSTFNPSETTFSAEPSRFPSEVSSSGPSRSNLPPAFHPQLAPVPCERLQQHGGQHQIPMQLRSDDDFAVNEENPSANLSHPQHSELRDPNNFEFPLFSQTPPPLLPSHFGNSQSETLEGAPLPSTTHVPSRFPSNQQREHHSGGVAGYTSSSSSSTPIAPGCRSEAERLEYYDGPMFSNVGDPQSTTSGTPLSRNRE